MVYFRPLNALWIFPTRRNEENLISQLGVLFLVLQDPPKVRWLAVPNSMCQGPLRELCEERIFWRTWTDFYGFGAGSFQNIVDFRDIRWYPDQNPAASHGEFPTHDLRVVFLRTRQVSGIKSITSKRWTIHNDHVGWWITQRVVFDVYGLHLPWVARNCNKNEVFIPVQ